MADKIKKTPSCESCETIFQDEVNELVDNVKGYTEKDHLRKQHEIEKAFEKETKK